MPQSFFFNTDHQLEAVNATPLYPKPLITALADMKIILFSKTFQINELSFCFELHVCNGKYSLV